MAQGTSTVLRPAPPPGPRAGETLDTARQTPNQALPSQHARLGVAGGRAAEIAASLRNAPDPAPSDTADVRAESVAWAACLQLGFAALAFLAFAWAAILGWLPFAAAVVWAAAIAVALAAALAVWHLRYWGWWVSCALNYFLALGTLRLLWSLWLGDARQVAVAAVAMTMLGAHCGLLLLLNRSDTTRQFRKRNGAPVDAFAQSLPALAGFGAALALIAVSTLQS